MFLNFQWNLDITNLVFSEQIVQSQLITYGINQAGYNNLVGPEMSVTTSLTVLQFGLYLSFYSV